jgi:hypothetical protein
MLQQFKRSGDGARRFSQSHRHLFDAYQDLAGTMVLLSHLAKCHDGLCKLCGFLRSILLLLGLTAPEDPRLQAANCVLEMLEVHMCSEGRGAFLQNWIAPLSMLFHELAGNGASRRSVEDCRARVLVLRGLPRPMRLKGFLVAGERALLRCCNHSMLNTK